MRGADLHRPYRGVRSTRAPHSVLELALALQQRMPEHAFFCSVTAALIMGVPLPRRFERSRLLHVGVPSPARSLRAQGTVGYKLQVRPAEIRQWHGVRITTPERTWCTLSPHLDLADLIAAGDFLIHWRSPLATREGLRAAVTDYPGRRGKPQLRLAVDDLDDRSESRQESRLRFIIARAAIARIVANLSITTTGGYHYRADLAFPETMTIVEYQSDYHGDTAQFRRDMTRRARLEADGWVVLLVNADDLEDPDELTQRIRTLLASRAPRG